MGQLSKQGKWKDLLLIVDEAVQVGMPENDAEDWRKKCRYQIDPRLTVLVKYNDVEVKDALIGVANNPNVEVQKAPAEYLNFKRGTELGPFSVSWRTEGRSFQQTFQSIKIDWDGPKTFSLHLTDAAAKCARCGHALKNQSSARFCPKCGNRLDAL